MLIRGERVLVKEEESSTFLKQVMPGIFKEQAQRPLAME
jgi:hypothetical protein